MWMLNTMLAVGPSTWPSRLATRRRRTCPRDSRLAKKQRLTPPLLLLIKPWRPLRPPRTRTTPRVMRLYTAACLIKSSCLIRPALYLIAACKSTSLKEPSDQAPAFSLPVSQSLCLDLLYARESQLSLRWRLRAIDLPREKVPRVHSSRGSGRSTHKRFVADHETFGGARGTAASWVACARGPAVWKWDLEGLDPISRHLEPVHPVCGTGID
jgi:hypothetical protein